MRVASIRVPKPHECADGVKRSADSRAAGRAFHAEHSTNRAGVTPELGANTRAKCDAIATRSASTATESFYSVIGDPCLQLSNGPAVPACTPTAR